MGYGSLYLSCVPADSVLDEISTEVPLPVNLGLARGTEVPGFRVLVPSVESRVER